MTTPHDIVDEARIDQLVRSFYAQVREDDLLGPIFNEKIAEWEPHLQRITAFWSSLMLGTRSYEGHPMRMHISLPVDAQHFDRWLALFEATAHELFVPHIAARFLERARLIAKSFESGIAATHGVLLGRDERFVNADLRDGGG